MSPIESDRPLSNRRSKGLSSQPSPSIPQHARARKWTKEQRSKLPLVTRHLSLFTSATRAVSSVVERLVYTERVGGSKPSPPRLSILSGRVIYSATRKQLGK